MRDEFIDNNHQTPHFASQGTGREQFVESAKRFDGLRAKLLTAEPAPRGESIVVVEQQATVIQTLERAEKNFATKENASAFVSRLFGKLSERISSGEFFGDLFSAEVIEHSDFVEPTARSFLIRVLSGEKRPDNFVTAAIKPEARQRDPFNLSVLAMAKMFAEADDFSNYELKLNCSLEKVQIKITLTPKFVTLKRFVLVVSCAPSLEICYVLELLTQHLRRDWGEFDSNGIEISRRWWKMNWEAPCDVLVDKISEKLRGAVQESVDAAAKALLNR